MSNEIQKTLDQDVQNLVARLGQSRKNGTGLMLNAGDVGVLHEALHKLESGEYVVVPKEPTDAMVEHAYGTYEGATILPYSFYKAMIEAANHE